MYVGRVYACVRYGIAAAQGLQRVWEGAVIIDV